VVKTRWIAAFDMGCPRRLVLLVRAPPILLWAQPVPQRPRNRYGFIAGVVELEAAEQDLSG